jgi:hypothetical protein
MNGGARLAVGIALGGLLMLILHPISRAFIFYRVQPDRATPIVKVSPLITPRPASFAALLMQNTLPEGFFASARQVSEELVNNPVAKLDNEQYERGKDLFGRAANLDSDNAFWPQLSAAIAVRATKTQEALHFWESASKKSKWDSGQREELLTLWNKIATEEGHRFAWQGLLALHYRKDDWILAIARTAGALKDSNVKTKIITIINASLIRDGASSIQAKRLACQIAYHAAGIPTDELQGFTPSEREKSEAQFLDEVSQKIGPDAATRIRIEMRRNAGWMALLMPSHEVQQIQNTTQIISILSSNMPSSVFIGAVLMSLVGGVGWCFSRCFGQIPHPDPKWVYLFSGLTAILAFTIFQAWPLSIWFLVLGAMIATPNIIRREKPKELNTSQTLLLTTIGLTAVSFFIAAIFFSSPSIRIALTIEPVPWLGSMTILLCALGLIVLSFTIPCAVIWARQTQAPVLTQIGMTLQHLGAKTATLCLLILIISTPTAIYFDNKVSQDVKKWIIDEAAAFRITES